MPTPLSSLPLGPGRVAYGSGPTTLYSAGDIKAQIKSKWNDLKSDQYGDADKALVDQSVEVGFKPQSLWSLLATVYPTALINPTLGTRPERGLRVPALCPVPAYDRLR